MKTVYFVRHGQTEYNLEKRLQGWCDSPLSDNGKEQVARVAAAIAPLDIERAWVSPLGRAQQTAEIHREVYGLEWTVDRDLKEVSFGDFEHHTISELDEMFPGQWDARMNDKWNYCPPNGESNSGAAARAERIARRIENRTSERPLLIVAHFAINRILIAHMAGLEPDDAMEMNVPHEIVYRLQQNGNGWGMSYQMADRLAEGFLPGWLPQVRSENQVIPKY